MRAQERHLKELVQGPLQYRVPLCQRPYEWDKTRWGYLWNDLMQTAKRRRPQKLEQIAEEMMHKHFFSAIVIKPLNEGDPVPLIDVIDGQQRIMTCMLLVKAVLDTCESLGQESGVSETQKIKLRDILYNPEYARDGIHDTKMFPGRRDRPSFQGIMNVADQPFPDTGRIRDSYDYFAREAQKWLSPLGGPERDESLKELLDALHDGFVVAKITLDQQDDYYEAFESLNGKGLQLAESDKIRNYCFMLLSPLGPRANDTFYDTEWLPMEERISRYSGPANLPEELDKLLLYWGIMRKGEQFGIEHLYHRICHQVEDAARSSGVEWVRSQEAARQAESFFEELIGYSEVYCALRWPALFFGEADAAVSHALTRLTGDLNMKSSATPLLLALLGKYLKSTPRDVPGLLQSLEIIESFAVRRIVCNMSTNQHNRIFMQLGHLVYEHADWNLTTVAERLREDLKVRTGDDEWPRDADFRKNFVERDLERQGARRRFAKAVLLEINRRRPGSGAINPDTLTVEHIMPEELTEEWRQHLGPAWENTHRTWLRTFGNLTILEPALNRGQALFRIKKGQYAQSVSIITQELAGYPEQWTPEQISQRAGALFETARSIWSRPV